MHNYRRKIPSALACCLLAAGLFSCSQAQSDPPPPVAEVIPKTMTEHGNTRVDNYFWLKERENPKVIDYLKAENAYTEEVMKHTEALQEKLFEEIKGRIKQDDRSVPYRHDEYFYYTRQEDGKEYDIYCRKKGSLDSLEQIILNVNTLAEGHDFYQVAGIDASPDHSILAYGVDTVGRRFYTLHFKDMNTGTSLPDLISDVTGNMVWAADNKTIFYSAQDPETLR
jgi:oligopeptidase B